MRTSTPLTTLISLMVACVYAHLGIASEQFTDTRVSGDHLQATFSRLEDEGFTGFAIIAIDGEIVFSRGAGAADAVTGAPFTLDTQVDVASITKTLTGMIVSDLVTSGKLAGQATLADFFPDAPAAFAEITVHQLLTHTSGLPDVVGDDAEPLDFDAVRKRAFATTLLSPPGNRYYYSNLGYTFLAAIIEQVTGEPYEKVLMSYLASAGAPSTGYDLAYIPEEAVRFGDGQTLKDASWGGHAPGWNLMGNGGVVSSARDMIRWCLAYSRGQIVSPAARDLARTPFQAEDAAGSTHYGYGLVVEDDPELGHIYWHNGGSRRFNAHWRELADLGVVIFVTSNQWDVSADRAVITLCKALVQQ